jgi:hypothetical protein
MDLLMSIDWDNLIDFSDPKEQVLPPLAGLSQFKTVGESEANDDEPHAADGDGTDATASPNENRSQAVAAVATAQPVVPSPTATPASLRTNVLTIGGISLLLVFVASLWIVVRRA